MINIIKSIKVNNEICLVTGSTGHLGKEFAKLLAEMGYNLILTDKNQKLNILKRNFEKLSCKSLLQNH